MTLLPIFFSTFFFPSFSVRLDQIDNTNKKETNKTSVCESNFYFESKIIIIRKYNISPIYLFIQCNFQVINHHFFTLKKVSFVFFLFLFVDNFLLFLLLYFSWYVNLIYSNKIIFHQILKNRTFNTFFFFLSIKIYVDRNLYRQLFLSHIPLVEFMIFFLNKRLSVR